MRPGQRASPHKVVRQLQITHTGGNPTQRLAKSLQTALAACLVMGAGAAETGARETNNSLSTQSNFLLGDTETGGVVTRTNPGTCECDAAMHQCENQPLARSENERRDDAARVGC